MPNKSPTFNAALEPLAAGLPREVAAAVGDVVARHTYLDWVLGQVMYDLMEISIKQGRVIMKLPRPRVFVDRGEGSLRIPRPGAALRLRRARREARGRARACRALTRSVYMRETGAQGRRIQLVRSPVGSGPGGDLQPEAQRVDAKFLAARRRQVENATPWPKAASPHRQAPARIPRPARAPRLRPPPPLKGVRSLFHKKGDRSLFVRFFSPLFFRQN